MNANNSDSATFEDLCHDLFDYFTDAEWDTYYGHMAPHMESADASIRHRALERLCMAVMSAEPSTFWRRKPRGPVPPAHAVKRLAWLTRLVSQAQLKFFEPARLSLATCAITVTMSPFVALCASGCMAG
jgi:hypothetical protein